jgi:hypothetical protein
MRQHMPGPALRRSRRTGSGRCPRADVVVLTGIEPAKENSHG